MLPPKEKLKICFAHVAYHFAERFALRNSGYDAVQAWSKAELEAIQDQVDVLVVSGLWENELAASMPKLRYIQSISAGVDRYDPKVLSVNGIRLASASGANARAVSEHAMSLILALARRLPEARDNQTKRHWRGMIGDLTTREDELSGKTILIVGLGQIGGRLARLSKAFDMKVIGLKRDVTTGTEGADEVRTMAEFKSVLPKADIIALTCPLTAETQNMVDAEAFSLMKKSAWLVNCARGKVVKEDALIEAMTAGRIAGAALDVTVEEPLPPSSQLWELPNTFITPHTGGETRKYEDAVIDILLENLGRLERGQTALRNQVV
ncbi:D-2-hydroxyacid dehydrogenase [Acetobacteraceae bacterium H6797]|nr:D-2-hydroxyacid dehydrogenase [Acetobacteraceae bacterium H6797]